jgi:hypothetical protein
MPHAAPPAPSRRQARGRSAPREALLQEAEAQRALAELFPELQKQALRAIQDLFPLARRGRSAADSANEDSAH